MKDKKLCAMVALTKETKAELVKARAKYIVKNNITKRLSMNSFIGTLLDNFKLPK